MGQEMGGIIECTTRLEGPFLLSNLLSRFVLRIDSDAADATTIIMSSAIAVVLGARRSAVRVPRRWSSATRVGLIASSIPSVPIVACIVS